MNQHVQSIIASVVILSLIAASEPATQERPLAPGDLLNVSFAGMASRDHSTTLQGVDANGRITLPYIEPIRVANLTTRKAAEAVDQAYHESNWIQSANAIVERIELKVPEDSSKPRPFATGDFIQINFLDAMERFDETKQVPKDGVIQLPHGIEVNVIGKTDAEVEETIVKAYKDAVLIERLAVCVVRLSPQEVKALEEQRK